MHKMNHNGLVFGKLMCFLLAKLYKLTSITFPDISRGAMVIRRQKRLKQPCRPSKPTGMITRVPYRKSCWCASMRKTTPYIAACLTPDLSPFTGRAFPVRTADARNDIGIGMPRFCSVVHEFVPPFACPKMSKVQNVLRLV